MFIFNLNFRKRLKNRTITEEVIKGTWLIVMDDLIREEIKRGVG